MDVENTFVVRSLGFTERYQHEVTIRTDLRYLRSLPDVFAITTLDDLPLSGRGNRLRVMLKEGDLDHAVRTASYEIDDQGLDALGVGLVGGRNFAPQEILGPKTGEAAAATVPQVLITQALAEDLSPARMQWARRSTLPAATRESRHRHWRDREYAQPSRAVGQARSNLRRLSARRAQEK